MQNLKATKNFSNFSLFKTHDSRNNNFIQNADSGRSLKQGLPSRKTDQYHQYKELKLFRQLSNDDVTSQGPPKARRANAPCEDDSNGKTLRNAASHGILANGSFVRSNNLNGIKLDTDSSRNTPSGNTRFGQSTQRVRFDIPGTTQEIRTTVDSANEQSTVEPPRMNVDALERKQQISQIQFVGHGTTKDIDGKHWKLLNRQRHLKHQQDLLDQIHDKRRHKSKQPRASRFKRAPARWSPEPAKMTQDDKYFSDLPRAITNRVKEGLDGMVESLKQGIECNNRKMEGEAERLKKLSLALLQRRQMNEDELAKLRQRLADSHYKNLVHKENVLGIFAQGCQGLFGNYYLPNMDCDYICCRRGVDVNCHKKCFCYGAPGRVENDTFNCRFLMEYGDSDAASGRPFCSVNTCRESNNTCGNHWKTRGHRSHWNSERDQVSDAFRYELHSPTGHCYDFIDEKNPVCLSVRCKEPYASSKSPNAYYRGIHKDMTCIVPIRNRAKKRVKKTKKNSRKVKDLMRLNKQPELKQKIYARPATRLTAINLMKLNLVDPDEILEFSKSGDTESLLTENNLYLDYLLKKASPRTLGEAKYMGENCQLFK